MRILYDPGTIVTVISAGLSLIGGIAEGGQQRRQARDEARFLEAQANQEAVARRRDLDDLRKERARTLARSRAVLAAQGADTASGDALNILRDQAASFAIKENRLLTDSNTREQSFLSRARNVRDAGRSAQFISIFGGATGAFATSASLLKPSGSKPKVGGKSFGPAGTGSIGGI